MCLFHAMGTDNIFVFVRLLCDSRTHIYIIFFILKNINIPFLFDYYDLIF